MAYDSEMNKVSDTWSRMRKTDVEELALYTMKSFVFHPTTPDLKVSHIIKDALFACSETDKFLFISDLGIRPTKAICHFHEDFAPFMTTPVLPMDLRPLLTSTILPNHLKVGFYTLKDVVKELNSRWLTEAEMAAWMRWWTASFGIQGIMKEQHKQWQNELLKVGKTHSGGKEVRLSSITKFIDGQMLRVRRPDDPLPEDTIPPALIQGLSPHAIPDTFGWQEMSIAH
ncbi:uncharacterized protein EDB91DRAFT_1105719 [Suillus paluster]|uniref:uncharacterized protein n=1 Tax=Suillus paluster TaxID=48578 RepID=UPI001B878561|nr:uncharacterized protein EDB91DRAFT_1105719 [Suillus paluster]KAG1751471.1 hypothetical protein EDB91DRAFT_1105719 [Suillus paluster]